jgi:diguanylate cyclase (GGDEF)-like protein
MNRLRESDELKRMNEIFAYRGKIADALNTMLDNLSLYNGEPFNAAMSKSLAEITDAMGITRITVFRHVNLVDEERLQQIIMYDAKLKSFVEGGNGYMSSLPVIRKWEMKMMQNEYINLRYSYMDENEQDFLSDFNILAMLLIPVFIRGEYWGCVAYMDFETERLLGVDCMDIMRSASRMIVNNIIRADLENRFAEENTFKLSLIETLTRRDKMLKALSETALTFLAQSNQSPKDQFYESMKTIAGYVNINRICIWKREMTYNIPRYTLFRKWSSIESDIGSSIEEGGIIPLEPIIDWDAIFSKNGYINCMLRELSEAKKRLFSKFNINTILAFPVFSQDNFWGVISFDNYDDRLYNNDETDILRYASLMIGSAVIREEESEKIYFDQLTGIYNRRFLDENLLRLIKTLSRSGSILSVLMIDIDLFKPYNDTYGHVEGDACLREVAEALRESVTRADDFVARYGGEEFVMVLPNTSAEGARVVAERLRTDIISRRRPHSTSDVKDIVTVSVGAVTGKVLPSHTGQDFIIGADTALDTAKRTGRNRYCHEEIK